MKISEFVALQKELADECATTVVAKTADYASPDDVFLSFRIGSALVELLQIDARTARGDALYNILKKLARLCNLNRRDIATPANESIRESIKDLHVYVDLYYGIFVEDVRNYVLGEDKQ